MRRSVLALALVGLVAVASVVAAAPAVIVEVMRDPVSGLLRYEPEIAYIQPGESVLFKNAGGVHATRFIPGMAPIEEVVWWGQIGEDLEVTFDKPGVYGHKCAAAYSLGLVGLVVVGDASVNLEKARSVLHPPAAAERFEAIFTELENQLER